MAPEVATPHQSSTVLRLLPPPQYVSRLQTLLQVSQGDPASMRRAAFSKFSSLEITGVEAKTEIMTCIIGCTASEAKKRDLKSILAAETNPYLTRLSTHEASDVLFEYACEKLLAMKHNSNMTPHEREYFQDMLSCMIEAVSADKSRLKAANGVLKKVLGQQASAEVQSLAFEALVIFGVSDFTYLFKLDTLFKLACDRALAMKDKNKLFPSDTALLEDVLNSITILVANDESKFNDAMLVFETLAQKSHSPEAKEVTNACLRELKFLEPIKHPLPRGSRLC